MRAKAEDEDGGKGRALSELMSLRRPSRGRSRESLATSRNRRPPATGLRHRPRTSSSVLLDNTRRFPRQSTSRHPPRRARHRLRAMECYVAVCSPPWSILTRILFLGPAHVHRVHSESRARHPRPSCPHPPCACVYVSSASLQPAVCGRVSSLSFLNGLLDARVVIGSPRITISTRTLKASCCTPFDDQLALLPSIMHIKDRNPTS